VLGVPRSEICVRFKRHTGVTIGRYLRDLRLDRAAVKLVTSADSIKTIWIDVGYRYDSNFNHDFRQRFGVSPGQYRARGILAAPDRDASGPGVATVPVPATPHTSAPGLRADPPLVLVVDDDDRTREGLTAALTARGSEVLAASTGRDGLRRAAQEKPDAVLLDHWLGDMDGGAWLRALRRKPACRDIRLVLWSADWDLDMTEEARALGATWLEKGCCVEEVMQVLSADRPERERTDLTLAVPLHRRGARGPS
jgi:CheY-like chemotaxis protein